MKNREDKFTWNGEGAVWDTPDGKPPRRKTDVKTETKRIIKKQRENKK